MNSIFARLRRYRPTADRDPLEDFTTEALVGTLEANPELACAFAGHLARGAGWTEPLPARAKVTWRTQVRVETGIIDMLVEIEGGPVLVCEHKVWAPLDVDQIEKYRGAAEAKYGSRVRTVLISARRAQWTQPADLRMTWADVHLAIADAAATTGPGPFVDDLLAYLRSEGLGPSAPVAHESLLSYVPAQRLVPALRDMFLGLVHDVDWSRRFAPLHAVLGKPLVPPMFRDPPAWGRIGLDLARPWRPGAFVGVMLDGADHRVPLVDSVKGPDFTFIVSHNPQPGSSTWEAYVLSPEFTALRDRLKGDAGPYTMFDVVDQPPKAQNRWHPLHLRRPLLDVLRGTSTAPEQATRFVEEMELAMQVLLHGGELADLAGRLRGVATEEPATHAREPGGGTPVGAEEPEAAGP